MKFIRAVLIGPLLAITLLSGVAGAQSYEGATLEDGIFFVPDNPTGGEEVNVAIAGLAPNAEVIVELQDSNNQGVDGLVAVQSAIAFRADINGNVNVDFMLPENLPVGAYTVLVRSTRLDGSPFETNWDFIVGSQSDSTATGNTASPNQQTGDLAFTGTSSRVTAVGGGILVLLGLGLVVVATTSRRQDGVVT